MEKMSPDNLKGFILMHWFLL